MLDEIMYLNNKKPLFKYIFTMRQFIRLNPKFNTIQQAPWIKLIEDYFKHKDLFRAIGDFEKMYNEPWVKPENIIDIINNELDLSL